MTLVRRLLLLQAVAFAAASAIHTGILIADARDPYASVAEGLIAVVLLAAFVASRTRPSWTRPAAIAAQGFALLGDLVGLYLFVSIQPDKVVDIAFHLVMALVLVAGIWLAARVPTGDPTSAGSASSA